MTVSVAPIPTQMAYAVPTGRSRMAKASPDMLMTIPIPKMMVGVSRLKPSDLPSAVAHTASKIPDTISTIQAMMNYLDAVLSQAGYGAPRPGASWLGKVCHEIAPGANTTCPLHVVQDGGREDGVQRDALGPTLRVMIIAQNSLSAHSRLHRRAGEAVILRLAEGQVASIRGEAVVAKAIRTTMCTGSDMDLRFQ